MTLARHDSKVLKRTLRGLNMQGDNNLTEWKPSQWVLQRLERLGYTSEEVKMINRRRDDDNKRRRSDDE
tara:strand:+ start:2305 stop:2511 length:207 start_codon:yes stop_codon:yes gene_type:complete